MKILLCLLLSSVCFAGKSARTIDVTKSKMANIRVPIGRTTIMDFPTKPKKVILGQKGLFLVEYLGNDLAISALNAQGNSNLFVYLEGRRFGFDLKIVPTAGDEIVIVRDRRSKNVAIEVEHE